jgi:hypothetical protein
MLSDKGLRFCVDVREGVLPRLSESLSGRSVRKEGFGSGDQWEQKASRKRGSFRRISKVTSSVTSHAPLHYSSRLIQVVTPFFFSPFELPVPEVQLLLHPRELTWLLAC